jgi:hypothetical protein
MMMDMADADKDGSVSAAEFTAAGLGMFDKADTNKDGTVTSAERRAAMESMHDGHDMKAMPDMKGMGHDHHPDAPAGK